jgi:hypothetical protein
MVTNGKPAQQETRDSKGRFVPGQSGNPNGSPRKPQSVSMLLRELIEGNPEKVLKKWQKMPCYPTGAMVIAKALFSKMSKGDLTAIKEGLDRIEGKVVQPMNLGGENGNPLTFTLRFDNASNPE